MPYESECLPRKERIAGRLRMLGWKIVPVPVSIEEAVVK
jgi:hypothetical protein